MKIKAGVDITGCRAEILLAAIWLEQVFVEEKLDMVITSGTEGKHRAVHSAHYRGDAIDIRNYYWMISEVRIEKIAAKMQAVLKDDYWVLLEGSHFHVEYRPVYQA